MLARVFEGVHSSRKRMPHDHCAGSMRRRKSSGASSRQIHCRIFEGASGLAHGSAWHTEICPPLANEGSMPAASRRSPTTTYRTCCVRHQAGEVPMTPAPRTKTFIGEKARGDLRLYIAEHENPLV